MEGHLAKIMYTIKIFNKEIQVRDYYCQLDELTPQKISEPYINIYVTITNFCNANCEFCCNANNKYNGISFNFEKFKKVVQEINSNVKINKCSFTGGEPTIQLDNLKKCLNLIKNTNSEIFTVINTNGTNIDELINLLPLIDSISLSRHHYNDDVNAEIFHNISVPNTKDIFNFPNKTKLHLSCNLIKEHIGNIKEVIKYLEWASTTGCNDVGFVSLMSINEYCKNQFVDFNTLNFEEIDNVFITKNWNYQNLCRCRNYNYIANNAEIIDVYARYYVNPQYSGNALVFDGQNLRLGFNGEIIY